jgi:hypothetical protein
LFLFRFPNTRYLFRKITIKGVQGLASGNQAEGNQAVKTALRIIVRSVALRLKLGPVSALSGGGLRGFDRGVRVPDKISTVGLDALGFSFIQFAIGFK